MVVIVDTTVWVDYFRPGMETPETEWLDRAFGRQRIGLTDVILCEVLRGVRRDESFQAVHDELLKCQVFELGGTTLAVAAARNYRALRQRGYTVRKTIACLIATFCLQQGHALLHNDRDFDPFEECLGLQVIHPDADARA
jgi:predicted nucleic acid-binding protein